MAEVESYQQVISDSSEELISFEDSTEGVLEENLGGIESPVLVEEEGKSEESKLVYEEVGSKVEDDMLLASGVEDVTIESIPEVQESTNDGFPVQPKAHVNGSAISTLPSTSCKQEGFEEVSEKEKGDGKLKSPLALWIMEHNLPPQVISLMYWVDLQRSTGVFGGLLLILLSLRFYPLIVVFTSTTLCLLVVAFLYRIGMTIVKAVQKTSSEHPFKLLLEENVEIPEELMAKWASKSRIVINEGIRKMQCLLLVQDTVASLKAMVVCWLISYVASCINFITLCILLTVVVFTVPKLYEEKQKEVDQLLVLAMEKGCVAYSAVEQKLPEKIKIYFKCDKKD